MTKNKKFIIVFVVLFCLISGAIYWENFGVPFVGKEKQWSIGIYTGSSPFSLASPPNVINPVLTAKNVKDMEASFVADPFMVYEGDNWYLFFEVLDTNTGKGGIGLATSNDGFKWNYKQIVLAEPFHLSYPYVFKWKNEYYMIPESNEAKSIRLYKAVDFPTKWIFINTLLQGHPFVDSSVVNFGGKWWMFTTIKYNNLFLYYADKLSGPWKAHPQNPILFNNPSISRSGGRVLIFDGRIFRFTQDGLPDYGRQVRAFETTELTTLTYKEKEVVENPILKPSGRGWNADGMHNIDPHKIAENRWIACVDGYRYVAVFGLKY